MMSGDEIGNKVVFGSIGRAGKQPGERRGKLVAEARAAALTVPVCGFCPELASPRGVAGAKHLLEFIMRLAHIMPKRGSRERGGKPGIESQ